MREWHATSSPPSSRPGRCAGRFERPVPCLLHAEGGSLAHHLRPPSLPQAGGPAYMMDNRLNLEIGVTYPNRPLRREASLRSTGVRRPLRVANGSKSLCFPQVGDEPFSPHNDLTNARTTAPLGCGQTGSDSTATERARSSTCLCPSATSGVVAVSSLPTSKL